MADCTMAGHPEISQWLMIPEFIAEGLLSQLGYSDTVFISRFVLGYDIHGELRQVEVRSDTGGSSNAGGRQNFTDQSHSQFMCSHSIELQIGSHIQEHLVYTVDKSIVCGDVLAVDAIYLCGCLQIISHLRLCDIVGQLERRILCELDRVRR